jgi:hypothetical protein
MFLTALKQSTCIDKIKLASLAGVLFVASLSAPAVVAQESPEVKLEAVKQALVDLALGAEVQIDSMAYMDSSGKLHESAVLHSNAGVRGVRVLSYLEEAKKASKATVKATIMSDSTCREARVNLRRQAIVRIVDEESLFSAGRLVGDHSIYELAVLLEDYLIDTLSLSEDWSVSPRTDYNSNYEQYLFGSSVDQVPYLITIKLAHGVSAEDEELALGYTDWVKGGVERSKNFFKTVVATAGGLPKHWPSADLMYEITLIDRSTNVPLLKDKGRLYYPAVARGYSKDSVPEAFLAEVENTVSEFEYNVGKLVTCRPHQFQLQKDRLDSENLIINAGQVAGITVGDQFIISTHPDLLKQALSNKGLATLSLARVKSVSKHSATLERMAGPDWSSMKDFSRLVATYF